MFVLLVGNNSILGLLLFYHMSVSRKKGEIIAIAVSLIIGMFMAAGNN